MGELNGMYGKSHAPETKTQIAESLRGHKQSAEHVAKKAAASRGTKREKIQCTYCNELIAVNMYKRWHGDNCKHKA